jgi:hypothetical protein
VDAKIAFAQGGEIQLSDLPVYTREPAESEPPFSFVYGGKHSSGFLGTWKLQRSTMTLDEHRTRHLLSYADPPTGLMVRLDSVEYHDFPVVEWTLYFKNTGSQDSPILERIRSMDLGFVCAKDARAILRFTGGSGGMYGEFAPQEARLDPLTTLQYTPREGRASDPLLPFFNLDFSGGTGVIVGMGWPGQWEAIFTRDQDHRVVVRTGLEFNHFRLHPGEEIRGPLVTLLFWSGDWIDDQNVWRRWLVGHNLPRPGGKPLDPLISFSTVYPPGSLETQSEEKQKVFIDRYQQENIKLDEVDNAFYPDADNAWGFPECSVFPSGMDGEQMHNLLGVLFQQTHWANFKQSNRRTYSEVRATHSFAAPYPFVLYSDIYEQEQYIRMVANSGFGGVLWSPELREAKSDEDLLRRLQLSVFAALTHVDGWQIKNPPWMQYDIEKNNKDEFLPQAAELEAKCRKLLQVRMSLIPYLYSQFVRYRQEGVPPFRALVVDYPADKETYKIDNEFLAGDSLLVAPMIAGQSQRSVYLPAGDWYCFWTYKKYAGGQRYEVTPPMERIPVFVKGGRILPLAKPVDAVAADTCFEVTAYVFGDSAENFVLYEDDGLSYDFEKGRYNTVALSWTAKEGGQVKRMGQYEGQKYNVVKWVKVNDAMM